MTEKHMDFPYEDIVDLPHHVSSVRPAMSMHDRAGQFAPFAALTGFGAVITKTGQRVQTNAEQNENEILYSDDAFSE